MYILMCPFCFTVVIVPYVANFCEKKFHESLSKWGSDLGRRLSHIEMTGILPKVAGAIPLEINKEVPSMFT